MGAVVDKMMPAILVPIYHLSLMGIVVLVTI